MNRIVLIGNGFDLAHGLKTRYEDFINWYWYDWGIRLLRGEGKTESDGLCSFTLKVNIDVCSWSYFWGYYCKRTNPLKPWNPNEIINIAKEDKNLCEFKYIGHFLERICQSISTKKWVDIENVYYDLLIQYAKEESPKEKIDELNKQLSYLQEKLIEYLSGLNFQELSINDKIKKKIYAPFCEKDIAIGGKQAWDEHIQYGLKLDEKGWRHKLWQYGMDNASCMSYVNSFKQKFEKGEEILECDKTEFLLPNHIMLINFNYTQTAELYVTPESDFPINYIHGKLDKPESVIFGYGDELDENYKKLENLRECDGLRNIKSIKYLEAENYRKILAFIESEPYQILIMGHSCGNSDRTLLNRLFEHKNCVSIKPYYYIKEDGTNSYLETAQNISRNFTDMNLMRDRVVNKVYCEKLT